MNQGYATYGQYAPRAHGGYPQAMMPTRYDVIGQTPATEPSMLDKTKDWLGAETWEGGPKRGYVLGGAALAVLVYMGYQKRWFR